MRVENIYSNFPTCIRWSSTLISKYTVEIFDNNSVDMDIKKLLKNIGLNEKEAAVYLATLELGEAKAAEVSNRADLNRVTCYDILDKLIHKGYISTYNKKNLKFFSATSPKDIWEEVKTRQNEFESALPQLMNLHDKRSGDSKIHYYEGLDGIKQIYKDSLHSKTEILNYANSQAIRAHWKDYQNEYVKERVKRRIFLRGIALKDEWGDRIVAEKHMYRDIRLVTPGPFDFNNQINIYDDKVSFVSFGKDRLVGMIIESAEMADAQRAIFLMAWEYATKMNKS